MSDPIDLKYLIVGTGRSGTVYMARLLTSLGIPCGHEAIFDWRGSRWAERRLKGEEPVELSYVSTMAIRDGEWTPEEPWLEDVRSIVAESSYMSAPFLNEPYLCGTTVLHVVRNPVKVIHSFCNYLNYFRSETPTNSYEQFIYRHLPELKKPMPMYDRAALYYIGWNEMIEYYKPVFFYRVEDPVGSVLEFLGKSGPHFHDCSVNTFRKQVKEEFFPHKIESAEIRHRLAEVGQRYGYKIAKDIVLL